MMLFFTEKFLEQLTFFKIYIMSTTYIHKKCSLKRLHKVVIFNKKKNI